MLGGQKQYFYMSYGAPDQNDTKRLLPHKSHQLHQILIGFDETGEVVKVSDRSTNLREELLKISPRS